MQLDNTQANIFKVNGGIADILANRPTAQNTFYLFYSIDTQEIYYDNGTWVLIASAGGGGGANIYNTDGTLTGNRVLTGNLNNLTFQNVTQFSTNTRQTILDSLLGTTINAGSSLISTAQGQDYNNSLGNISFLIFDTNGQFFVNSAGQILLLNNNIEFLIDNGTVSLKTKYNGADNGLLLNFDTAYEIGKLDTNILKIRVDKANESIGFFTTNNPFQPNGLYCGLSALSRTYYFGELINGNRTQIIVNDVLNSITANENSIVNGLSLQFSSRQYAIGQLSGTGINQAVFTVDDVTQHFTCRALNPELILAKIGAQNEGSTIQTGNALPVTTGAGDLGQSLIVTSFDGANRTILKRGATLTFPLRFNGIPDYIVVGGSGIQNLGTGTTGLYVTSSINSTYNFKRIPMRETSSNWVFTVRIELHTQFGGVALNLGLRTIWSSATGSSAIQSLSTATRISEFGTNYDTQITELTVLIPKTVAGSPTNYYKFDILVERSVPGNTSVIGAFINFSI